MNAHKHKPTDDLEQAEELFEEVDGQEDRESRIEERESNNIENDFEELYLKSEEKYKRVLADYRNLEHRTQIERQQYIKVANRYLIESLLEPLDFMEQATKHIEDKGLQMVIDRFYQVLENEGLEDIKIKVGDPFDEKTMEAVDTAEGEEGKVVKIQQKGFKLNGSVLRHAKVAVGIGNK